MSYMKSDDPTDLILKELKKVYDEKIAPVEARYFFKQLHNLPPWTEDEFFSKPHVLMIGQYSTGKTSFIEYILGRSFPGQRIGPEPTTDRFCAVMHGTDERTIPGNALAVQKGTPYKGLQAFGNAFLNRFEGSQLPCEVLQKMTIIDTPGVLSGEKQRLNRGYDFEIVVRWFAERCDLILLLFDAHKLDISDELKGAIMALKGCDDKIRCILNKADEIDSQKLMRVYGALMWSLGKIVKTPEVLRVYTGSFWDQPLVIKDNAEFFEAEERELMGDIRNLPRYNTLRKINELVKRARLVKVNAYIVMRLKSEMPAMMGKDKKKKDLINDLEGVFRSILKTNQDISPGDFPDPKKMKDYLGELDFALFKGPKKGMMEALQQAVSEDIPRLLDQLPADPKGEKFGQLFTG